ncbi:MAG: hypothetical protein Q4B08_15150, partial [Propionibacteriaceae bacterium]|nr:hypothetical protein [Propionibacteriaceae bacterium]
MKAVLWLMVALALLAMLAWGVLHWAIVPRIDDFRPRLERLATRALGAPVTVGRIEAVANGLVPAVALHDLAVQGDGGQPALRVPRVLAAFSVRSLARRGLEQLVIDGPELLARRGADGRLLVAGIDLSGDASADTAVADWFFSQPELLLRGGQVRWVDDRRGAPPVTLSDVRLLIRNGPRRHQVQLDATPEAAWGERFTLVGHFRQPLLARHAGQWRRWSGRAWASLPRIDVSRLRQYADLGIDLREGHGALRAWVDVREGRPSAVTADLALDRVAAVLAPRLPPLALRALTGRVEWAHTAQGMALRTRALRFEDAGGAAWPGGNIALTLRDGTGGAASGGGELRADRLDLAALARLAAALPLGEAVHARLAAHPVQGLVQHLAADWHGPLDAPTDWRLRLKASGLAVGARAAARADAPGLPGIEGATLDVDARPGGGTATLAIAHGALSFPGVFEEPRIALASLNAGARWRVQGGHVAIDVDELRLHNADATGRFKVHWHTSDPAASPSRSRFP